MEEDILTSPVSLAKDTSGVGISFGLDRVYLCLEELNLFPDTVTKRASILFANFGSKESKTAFEWIQKLVELEFDPNFILMR